MPSRPGRKHCSSNPRTRTCTTISLSPCSKPDANAAAVAEWQETLRLDPDKIGTQITLAWILSTSPDAGIRDGTKALEFAQRAEQTSGGHNLMVFRVLAAAYAENGRFPEAINAAEEGAQRAEAQGQSTLAQLVAG